MPTALAFVTAGYIVQQMGVFFGQQMGVFFGRPSLATTAVSAVAGLALGLVFDPLTEIFFAPTVDGLVTSTLSAFMGGSLFFIAYDMGYHRR